MNIALSAPQLIECVEAFAHAGLRASPNFNRSRIVVECGPVLYGDLRVNGLVDTPPAIEVEMEDIYDRSSMEYRGIQYVCTRAHGDGGFAIHLQDEDVNVRRGEALQALMSLVEYAVIRQYSGRSLASVAPTVARALSDFVARELSGTGTRWIMQQISLPADRRSK